MKVAILTTDGGPHSPGAWSEQTAGEIMALVKVAADSTHDSEADKARKHSYRKTRMYLEADIMEALEEHHHENMELEKSLLSEGDERLHHPLHPDAGAVDAAVGDIVGCAAKYGEPWASAFNDDGGRAMIHAIVYRHFQSAMDIERSWHCDRKMATGASSDAVRQWKHFRHR